MRMFELLRPRLSRVLLATMFGVLSLCSALALTAVSAWLITRAWQMPPLMYLSVAVVAVRALAISRGVLGYCERLASHDVALRAAGSARERIYARLAGGPLDAVMRRHSGELVTRVGADVDSVSDALVRAVLPIGVAAVLAVAATTLIAVISPGVAAVLAVCLVVAGVIGPWLAASSAAAEEAVALQHHSARDVVAMTALEHAPELRVCGKLTDAITESGRRQREWGAAMDRAARPTAVASAIPIAAIGVTVLAAAVIGIGLADAVAPTTLAILMLVPLSAFEATTALPAAAATLVRSRIAARRLFDLAGCSPTPEPNVRAALTAGAGTLAALDLRSGYSPSATAGPFTISLEPGMRAIVTGPSGSGKTALLMTLGGLLPPCAGTVTLDGLALSRLGEDQLTSRIGFFAEDAHLFATTVRDNMLVVRGDCTDAEIVDALTKVGLGAWLRDLPDGLDTVLTGGPQAVSAGQRRRLLLARALISPARIVLLDEPTEHLDAADAGPMMDALLDPDAGLFSADRTVVVATHQPRGSHQGELAPLASTVVSISLCEPTLCAPTAFVHRDT